MCGAAGERRCLCELGSIGQVLGEDGSLVAAAETAKTVQNHRNAAARGEIPDLNSFSSCRGWDSPQQPGGRMSAAMPEECVE